jgi:glyoxylase-like metal-dependent hydrolase (beta-lactamase superfamily II)
MDDGEMANAPKGRMGGLFKYNCRVFSGEVLKRLSTHEWGKDVFPGITALGTPGDTPGHTSYVIASGSGRVYVQADVTNNPALCVRHPSWHAFFNQAGQMAEETRKEVYDMIVAEKRLAQGFDYPFPDLGHVEKDGSGYRVMPLHWTPKI